MKSDLRNARRSEDAANRLEETFAELDRLYGLAKSEGAKSAIRWAIINLDRGRSKRVRNGTAQAAKRKNDNVKELNNALISIAGNKSQRWTDAHDKIVMNAEMKDVDIAKRIGRSLKAITARRCKLKRARK